jgi:hypothetical protein
MFCTSRSCFPLEPLEARRVVREVGDRRSERRTQKRSVCRPSLFRRRGTPEASEKLDFMRTTNLFLIGLGLLLSIQPNLWAQPVPHHFTRIVKRPDNTIALTLDGRVATMNT